MAEELRDMKTQNDMIFAEQEKLFKECMALKDQVRMLDRRVSELERQRDRVFSVSSCEATSCTALNKQCQEMILVNKEGNLWTVSLRFSESGGMYVIRRGWRKFCLDNRCDIGEFNLVGDGKTTPLMCVCPERKECYELLSKYLSRKSGESSPLTHG